MPEPLIALISATPAAIPPAVRAFRDEFPDARVWNILDDRLLVEADEQGSVTPALQARMVRLIDHAVAERADGILLTCSMFGFVARAAQVEVPIYAPDEAAFDDAISAGYDCLLVVGSLVNPLADAVHRFQEAASRAGLQPKLESAVAVGAYNASLDGDEQSLLASLIDACRPFASATDAVLLAQYSLSPVAGALEMELGIPVLSGPVSAARVLRAQLSGLAR